LTILAPYPDFHSAFMVRRNALVAATEQRDTQRALLVRDGSTASGSRRS
jgi:hypothetical protein